MFDCFSNLSRTYAENLAKILILRKTLGCGCRMDWLVSYVY